MRCQWARHLPFHRTERRLTNECCNACARPRRPRLLGGDSAPAGQEQLREAHCKVAMTLERLELARPSAASAPFRDPELMARRSALLELGASTVCSEPRLQPYQTNPVSLPSFRASVAKGTKKSRVLRRCPRVSACRRWRLFRPPHFLSSSVMPAVARTAQRRRTVAIRLVSQVRHAGAASGRITRPASRAPRSAGCVAAHPHQEPARDYQCRLGLPHRAADHLRQYFSGRIRPGSILRWTLKP